MGAEFARQLARLGYNLILVARRREKLEFLAGEIRTESGVEVEVLPADLSSEAGVAAIEERIKNIPDLEMLVNNAGFGIPGGFIATEVNVSMTMLWVHVLAPVRFSRAALPTMIANGTWVYHQCFIDQCFFCCHRQLDLFCNEGLFKQFQRGVIRGMLPDRGEGAGALPGFYHHRIS